MNKFKELLYKLFWSIMFALFFGFFLWFETGELSDTSFILLVWMGYLNARIDWLYKYE